MVSSRSQSVQPQVGQGQGQISEGMLHYHQLKASNKDDDKGLAGTKDTNESKMSDDTSNPFNGVDVTGASSSSSSAAPQPAKVTASKPRGRPKGTGTGVGVANKKKKELTQGTRVSSRLQDAEKKDRKRKAAGAVEDVKMKETPRKKARVGKGTTGGTTTGKKRGRPAATGTATTPSGKKRGRPAGSITKAKLVGKAKTAVSKAKTAVVGTPKKRGRPAKN